MERTLPPAEISPLIKAARWGFLFAGIMYGASRYSRLYNKEQKRLAELERTRPEREIKERIEKERAYKEQMDELRKGMGVEL